jgi:hypothetical protein
MNELERFIMSGEKPTKGLDGTELRQLGSRAAAKYINDKAPLNSTIAGMAKESSLNHEQVKRVVEYANNATFGHLFKAGFGKNITFPMADASAVLQESAEVEKTASPKIVLPNKRYIPGQELVDLEAVFTDGIEKVAESAGMSSGEVTLKTHEFIDLHKEARNLESDKEILGDSFIEKLSSLRLACQDARNAGNTGTAVGAAIEHASPSSGLQEIIAVEVGELACFGQGLEKVASMGMAVMGDNQITGITQDLESISQKLTGTQQAIDSTNMAMRNLLSILRGPDPGGAANHIFAGRPSNAMPAPQPGAAPGVGGPQGPGAGAGPLPTGGDPA